MLDKLYLGDAVYAEFVDGRIILTVEYGFGPTCRIVLEDFVINNLIEFYNFRKEVGKTDATPQNN